MPDYYKNKVADCYLYFTSKCIVEAFHVHAEKNRNQKRSAKFFVREDGSCYIQDVGRLKNWQIKAIVDFIGVNYLDMYRDWKMFGGNPEYYRR